MRRHQLGKKNPINLVAHFEGAADAHHAVLRLCDTVKDASLERAFEHHIDMYRSVQLLVALVVPHYVEHLFGILELATQTHAMNRLSVLRGCIDHALVLLIIASFVDFSSSRICA